MSKCTGNLKQIGSAFAMYQDDSNWVMPGPVASNIDGHKTMVSLYLLAPYVGIPHPWGVGIKVFHCPSNPNRTSTGTMPFGYAIVNCTYSLKPFKHPSAVPVFFDNDFFHNGGYLGQMAYWWIDGLYAQKRHLNRFVNYACLDGHVETRTEDQAKMDSAGVSTRFSLIWKNPTLKLW
jgi:prepilin-type processing-associated H-X9-DG protein